MRVRISLLVALALLPASASAGPWDWEDLRLAGALIMGEHHTEAEVIGVWSGQYGPGLAFRVDQKGSFEGPSVVNPDGEGLVPTTDFNLELRFKNTSSDRITFSPRSTKLVVQDEQRSCMSWQTTANPDNFSRSISLDPGDEHAWTFTTSSFTGWCSAPPPTFYRVTYNAATNNREAGWAAVMANALSLQGQGLYEDALVAMWDGAAQYYGAKRDPAAEQLFDELKSQREQKLAQDQAAAQTKQKVATLLKKADEAESRRAWLDCRGYLEEAVRMEPSGEIQSRIARVDQAIQAEEQAKAQAAAAADLEKKQNAAVAKVESALDAKDVAAAKSALADAQSLDVDGATISKLQGRITTLEGELAAAAAAEEQAQAQQEAVEAEEGQQEEGQQEEQQPPPQQAQGGASESWKVTANEGVVALNQGDYDTAIAKFEQAQAEGGADDAQLARALETARGAKAHEARMVEAEALNQAAREDWARQQEEAQKEAERRQAAQVAAAERRVAEAQARADRQIEMVDLTADFLSRRIEAYANNASLRDMAREASKLDLSLDDPRALLGDYRAKVQTLKNVAQQKHEEFDRAMQDLIELTAKLLAEAEAKAQAAGAVAAGLVQAGGHIAIEKQKEAKEAKLRAELHGAFDRMKNDLVASNQSGLNKYVGVEAKALSWEAQTWSGEVAGFYQCNINYIHNNYSYEHTAWAEGSCDEPRGAPSSQPLSGARDRVALGRYKLERARLGGSQAAAWLQSAEILADGAVQANRKSPEAWGLKAELATDWIDRLAWYQRAKDLTGGSKWGQEVEATVPSFSQAFFAALDHGDSDFLDRSSKAGVHWLAESPDGRPPIVFAVERNNPETVKTTFRIFELDPATNGGTLLHLASAKNTDGSARALIELGVDPNATDEEGRTAYYVAVAAGSEAARAVLAEHDPDHLALMTLAQTLDEPLAADRLGQLALEQAIADDDPAAAEPFLKARPALLELARTEADTYPSWAARSGATHWLTVLLDHEVHPNTTDRAGDPVLHLAQAENHPETVALLLARGADVNLARATTGERPLHHAVDHGVASVDVLLAAGALVDLGDGTQRTAVHRAVDLGALEVVGRLLDERPNLTLQDADGATPLHLALGAGRAELADLILPDSLYIDAQDSQGRTPLHLAIAGSMTAQRKTLLDRGARLDLQDSAGDAPLHLALRAEKTALIERLITDGAPQDQANASGEQPIHLACHNDDMDTVSVLLTSGVDFRVATVAGRRPLHYAADGGADQVVLHLLALGADPKAKDGENWTPTKVARKAGFKDTAKLIKKYKAPKEEE